MSMLKRNNDDLVKTLMTLLRAEPKAHEETDPYDSDSSPIGDFAPASTMRLMPVESIANFDGDRDNRDAAASWLQRFEETAIACGWSDREILRRFRLHSDKPVHDWLLQVNPEFLSSWTKLRARFVKEYVKSPIPKTEVYYSMTQGPGEHLKAYFVRFNAAALRIKLDYRRNRENLAAHIDRFARTLTNRMLAQAINLQQFRTIDDLEDYLDKQQQQEAFDRFQARAKSAQSAPSHSHIRVSDRAKTRKPTVQFMDSAESVGASCKPRYLPLADHTAQPSKFSAMNVAVNISPLTMGHPETNCFKACAICTPPHNKFERCEKREKVAALKAFLEANPVEGLPSL
ncbi:unnamed protein product, partial [Aphanomyces euteiches]